MVAGNRGGGGGGGKGVTWVTHSGIKNGFLAVHGVNCLQTFQALAPRTRRRRAQDMQHVLVRTCLGKHR